MVYTIGEMAKMLGVPASTLRMVEYKCWYYETAQAAGTVEVLRDMPEDKVPEQFRAIRQELKQQPED